MAVSAIASALTRAGCERLPHRDDHDRRAHDDRRRAPAARWIDDDATGRHREWDQGQQPGSAHVVSPLKWRATSHAAPMRERCRTSGARTRAINLPCDSGLRSTGRPLWLAGVSFSSVAERVGLMQNRDQRPLPRSLRVVIIDTSAQIRNTAAAMRAPVATTVSPRTRERYAMIDAPAVSRPKSNCCAAA